MPEPKTLRELLPEKFREGLTGAESQLLDFAPDGMLLDLTAGEREADDPAQAGGWGAERSIRAGFLRWICTDKKVSALIDARGVQICGARIDGALDFVGAVIPHLLSLAYCSIKDGILFFDARTRTVNLTGTHTGPISGDRLKVEGALQLRNGFRAEGEVRLLGAKVGGNLDCSGGSFNNENGDALSADGIETKGDIFLNGGFSAKGTVRLVGAKVGGSLDCRGGCFDNKDGFALVADRMETKGTIFLIDGFSAKGTVRLLGAKLGGNLACSGGHFVNENGVALLADGIETKGCIFLNDGFSAQGGVRLVGAEVGGDLVCSGGSFISKSGAAFLAQRMVVEGNFFWEPKERPVGLIDLMHAKVGVLTDNKESWPEPGKLLIDGFEYGALAPDDTPKGARERLAWIELQLPPAKSSVPEMLTEPFQNKYPIKWIWVVSKRRFNKVWRSTTQPKPYGNFKDRPPFEFSPQPYEQLAMVLKNMGHESDSREVLIAKQEALRKRGGLSWRRKRWHWFLGFTMGHGYKPIRPVVFMLAMIILGAVGSYFAYEYSFMTQSKLSIFRDNMGQYPEFHSFIYSLDSFMPFVDLHQENYWIPANNSQHPRWSFVVHLYFWFHIILGWFASTLAAASLSGVVRKKD